MLISLIAVIGVANTEYLELQRAAGLGAQGHTATGAAASIAANRVSYLLDLRGPSMVIDTACSSSLVTIHLACQGLWSRETEMALAGGVFLQATPEFYQVANRAGMLSPEGKCFSFDARANEISV